MNEKFIALLVVIVIAIVGVSAFLLTQDLSNNSNGNDSNQTNGNNNTKINNNTNKTNVSVSAVLSGPEIAKEGDTISLIWTVTNNGNVNITNVRGIDQNEDHDFGTINPGQTKTHTFNVPIPIYKDVAQDFQKTSTVSDPFFIGGFGLSYTANGQRFTIQSNSIEILLN